MCPLCDLDCMDVEGLSKHLLAAHRRPEETGGEISYGFLCTCGKAFRQRWAYWRHSRCVHDHQPSSSQEEVHIEWIGSGPTRRGRALDQYYTAPPVEEQRPTAHRAAEKERPRNDRRHRSRTRRSPDRSRRQGHDRGYPSPKRRRQDSRGRQSSDWAARKKEAERRHHQASKSALARREVFTMNDFPVAPAASRVPNMEPGCMPPLRRQKSQ